MTGDRSTYAERGLIPRVVGALMAALRAEQGLASWQLRVSYLEVGRNAAVAAPLVCSARRECGQRCFCGAPLTRPSPSTPTPRNTALQIYNEAIFDLLDITTQPHEITLYEDGAGRLAVSGLRAADVRSEQEALALFFEARAAACGVPSARTKRVGCPGARPRVLWRAAREPHRGTVHPRRRGLPPLPAPCRARPTA
jgi:hypothetical protein